MATVVPMQGHRPSFSIVIEWDNARLSEPERTRRMLDRLEQQLTAHGG